MVKKHKTGFVHNKAYGQNRKRCRNIKKTYYDLTDKYYDNLYDSDVNFRKDHYENYSKNVKYFDELIQNELIVKKIYYESEENNLLILQKTNIDFYNVIKNAYDYKFPDQYNNICKLFLFVLNNVSDEILFRWLKTIESYYDIPQCFEELTGSIQGLISFEYINYIYEKYTDLNKFYKLKLIEEIKNNIHRVINKKFSLSCFRLFNNDTFSYMLTKEYIKPITYILVEYIKNPNKFSD